MRAIVVYESMFGNTREVAEAVAQGIEPLIPVEALEVGSAPPLQDLVVDLLVVGAPTHAFGLSRESTRRDASQRTGRSLVSSGVGLREWMDAARSAELDVAAFDTHVKKPNLPGWASHAAEKRLGRLGCRSATKAMTFYVGGLEGPLLQGETERARAWGQEVAQQIVGRAAPSAH